MSLKTKLCVIFLFYALLGENGFVCRIGDIGRSGQFTWNFEFFINVSIFLLFVSIFHNRKVKLKKNGYMKQHC